MPGLAPDAATKHYFAPSLYISGQFPTGSILLEEEIDCSREQRKAISELPSSEATYRTRFTVGVVSAASTQGRIPCPIRSLALHLMSSRLTSSAPEATPGLLILVTVVSPALIKS